IAAQIVGGIAGTMLAHAMFSLPVLQASETVRTGGAQWLSEVTATFGLFFVILAGVRFRADAVHRLAACRVVRISAGASSRAI
ncbi:hypothetical protein AB9F38_35250, partial [Rhizobium leguminosarum]